MALVPLKDHTRPVNPTTPQTATTQGERSSTIASMVMLALVTVIAFANAWPDTLVFDDKFFAGPNRESGLENLWSAFGQHVWYVKGAAPDLYRPLLLINLELESRLFGDWKSGYHLVNIALHVIATLLLYGFLRKLLRITAIRPGRSDLYALITALVFAVHPVHTEVVNSVFNRSSIFVSIFALGGLWWLLHNIDTRTARAWAGLALAYFAATLFKESALTLPGIAAAMVFILSPGTFTERIRRMLPVFWLLIPLAIYLVMRAQALAPDGVEMEASELDAYGFNAVIEQGRLPTARILLGASAVIGQAMKVIAWPYPLYLYYEWPTESMQIVYLLLNLAMIASSIVLFLKGRPGVALGMSFFYLAIVPASRVIGGDGAMPHLAERYLYLPSIGLAIVLAFAVRVFVERFSTRALVALALPLIILLSALTWDRNADWASQVLLFETEYDRGARGRNALRLLVGASIEADNLKRVQMICEDHVPEQEEQPLFAFSCGETLFKLGEYEEARASFERMAKDEKTKNKAFMNLAQVHARLGDMEAAEHYYDELLERIELPAAREYVKAELLVRIFPSSRARIQQAVQHLHNALELEPDYPQALSLLEGANNFLEVTSKEAAEPEQAPGPDNPRH